ncbi:MAG: hypothetical protein ACP5JJ_18925 [Anaerolineae bacterium]
MTTKPCIHSPARHWTISGIAILAGALLGTAAGWATWQLPPTAYPTWLFIAAPLVGMVILLIGVLNYDLLALIAFSTVGFVWFEPAPFDVLLVVLLGLGLLTGRLRWPSSKRSTLVHIGLWGLVVTNLLSGVVLVPIHRNLRFLAITLYVLALFCFVRMYVVDRHSARTVLTGYLVSAVLNVMAVLLGLAGADIPIPVVRFSIRGAGFFKDPNVYGPFVLLAALWVADQYIRRSWSVTRAGALLLLTGLLGAGAMLSMSRAVWINLAFSGLLYGALMLRRAPRTDTARLSVLALVVVLLALVALQFWGLDQVLWRPWKLYDYDYPRFAIQRRGIVAALTLPIGVGPGGWPNAHSLYVRTLAEHGVLGLASLGLLVGALVIPLAHHAWHKRPNEGILSIAVLVASIGGQLINSLVIDSIHWRHLWILLGLAWSALETEAFREKR